MTKVDRRRAKVARAHLVARDLWLERVPVPLIAKTLGVNKAKVWRWRDRFSWPARVPLGTEKAPIVAMAAKCWSDGLPRIEIALLCEISLGTLDTWRVRYGWEKRKPGRRNGSWTGIGKGRVARLTERDEAKQRRVTTAVTTFRASLPRWRCCGYLLDVSVCPGCQRRSPVCA